MPERDIKPGDRGDSRNGNKLRNKAGGGVGNRVGNGAGSKGGGSSVSKARLRLWLRFLKASRVIETQLRERMRSEFGSTLPRFDVLAALHRYEEGLKLSQLSGVLSVSNGNVTGIIDRLSADGLIVRVAVPGDRRATLVRLTPEGREEFERQATSHEAWINEMLADFTASEATLFSARLDRLRNTLPRESS